MASTPVSKRKMLARNAPWRAASRSFSPKLSRRKANSTVSPTSISTSPPKNAAPPVRASRPRRSRRMKRRKTPRRHEGDAIRSKKQALAPARFARREEKNGFGRRCQRPQGLRRRRGHSWRLHLDRRRRIRDFGRAVRLRKIDAPAYDRGLRVDRGRKDQDRGARRQQSRAERPRHCDGLSELRALSAQDGGREHELRPEAAAHAEGRDRGPGAARRRNPACCALSVALSAPALRRPASAGRDGAGDRARSSGVPVRRAAVESRRQAARADARRDQGTAPAAEDDDDLRDARPDRGDDDGRSHRRHARRRG